MSVRFHQRSLWFALVLGLSLVPHNVFAQQRRFSGNNERRGGDSRTSRNNTGARIETSSSSTAGSPGPLPKGMQIYHTITTRNVFDPDRRPMPEEGAGGERRESAPPPRSGYIILTGTMVADGKRLAFFNGSQSDFNKVAPINDQVAGCTITGISSATVDLKRGETSIVLPVGKQLTLDASSKVGAVETPSGESAAPSSGGAPGEGSSPGARPPGVSAESSSSSGSPGGGAAAPPGDRAEIIKRMMERRQKETSPK